MSDIQPSIDPVPILLDPGERSPFDKSVAAGLVGLVYLARQAFEEKRRKQCLEIIDAILKIEPGHEEARSIETSVRSDLARDFENAKTLVRDAEAKGDPVLYAEAAAALRRIIDADPDNLSAQALLHETMAAGYARSSMPASNSTRGWKRWSIALGSVAAVVLLAVVAYTNGTGSQVLAQRPGRPATAFASEPPEIEATVLPGFPEPSPAPQTTLLQLPSSPVPTVPAARRTEVEPIRVAVIQPAPAAAPQPPDVAPVVSTGNLAISAAVPVEIYRGEEYLGSTPTTLQLPAGAQTLEYRYQGFRQTLTHVIAGHETTTATVSFPIKVQINARPWAQVFIDGVRLTPIGQTPLGDVSVPIGSTLVFQNPGFPDKRYRVKAKDAAIQVAFP